MKKFCRKGHLKRSGKRWLALLMSVCLIGTMIPITARAENGSTETGLCEHHTEHTAECGYVAPVRGHECEHVHDESCGYQEASECNHVHTEECGENGENCTHVHTSECGYAEGHACEHVHTSECGYAEASEGSPCTFVCDICGKEAELEQTEGKLITAWQWIDEKEILDEETGNLALPGASEQRPAYFDDVTAFLPTQIQATVVNADDSENSGTGAEETITLGDWSCDNFPEEGAYSGSYTFAAALPEGYALSEEAEALTVLVELGGAQQWNVTGVSYRSCDENGTNWTTENCTSATEVSSEDTAWGISDTESWYVASGTVTIGSRVTVNGTVHLILADNCNLTINGGIGVTQGNNFTIYAQSDGNEMGCLTIQNVDANNAGIGGNFSISGKITINGGIVSSYVNKSSNSGAAIGGGVSFYGDVTINGGKVTAIGYCGAGIGHGSGATGGSGGVVINGGVVTASSLIGAGIGGGKGGDGKVTIKGGVITATSSKRNGIGSGSLSPNSTVKITDSPVIFASSISDQSGKENNEWSGIIFEGDTGKAYGTSVNVTTDCTIPSGKSLVVAAEQTISIAETATFTNEGTIYNSGTFTGAIANSGTIYNAGTISGASGGTIKQYSIEPTEIIAGTSAALALKVNGSDASVGLVAYTLDVNEANAELVEGTTLKAAKNVGSKIPVTATFTVDTVSMTRTEEITITECEVHSYGEDFDGNGFRVCSVCGKEAYQPANVVSATHHPELMDEHADYYAIENAGQLYWFAQQVNTVNTSMNAILTSDITVNSGASAGAVANCNGTKAEGWRDWTPIGIDSDHKYSGIFDGNGHTVSGLYFNDSNTDSVGLFGKNKYIIKNVGVIDSYFRGRNDVGGVCGANYDTITNCYNTSTVSGAGCNIGGVCGDNHSYYNKITNCYSIGKVSGEGNVGAVCGTASGFVTNCYYLTDSADENGGKTEKQFHNGEVAYLLSQGCEIEISSECYEETFTYDGSIWGQTLADENKQDYPALGGGKVFRNEEYAGCEDRPGNVTYVYSNTEKETVYIPHSYQISTDGMYHECSVGQEKIYHSDVAKFISGDEANTITGTCTECGNLGTVTLIAPTGDLTYNGTAREATVDASNSVLKGAIDIAYNTSDGNAPKDAGTYTASITLGTGENAATVSVEFSIEQATPTISWGTSSGEMTEIPVIYTGSEIAPNKLVPPTVTLVNGETYSGEISYSYRVQGSSDAFTSGLPTEIGIYEVKASIAADGNYKEAASTVKLTVNWLKILNSATLTDQGGIELTGDTWWAQSVTFTAPTGFTISNSLTDSFGTSFVYNEQTGADGTEVTYYLKNSNGEIAQKTATVRIDKTAPDWSGDNDGISIKTNKWKSLLSTISFGLFYKESVDVKVCANDSISGVAAYYYYIDSTGGMVMTAEQLDTLSFTEYTEGVSGQNPSVIVTSLTPNGNYIVYAYAVDKAGNRSAYVCSEGIVVDSTAPAISNIVAPSIGASTLTDTTAQISFTGSEAGRCFYMVKESSETAPTTITDFATEQANDGYSTWIAKQGVSYAAMTADGSNTVTLTGLEANTEYTLYLAAVDLAGNSIQTIASKTFTTCKTMPTVAAADMPKISGTYGQTVENMTLTPGTAKVGNTVITGAWTVTDSGKTDTPSVGTTATYQVTFTPDTSYNGMYDTVNVQVTPTVAQKPVTVTAENKTKTYGQGNPDLTFTVPEGALVGIDTKYDLGVTLSCEATAVSPVKEGGYAITGTSSSANYDVIVTPGTLTIIKADAQINVGTETYNKTFGDVAFNLSDVTDTNTEANVQYEVTAGDAVSVSNGTVTILKAGTAEITVSLPASTNYNAADTKT
ncbi:MAG: MBG domain-containing protein, partial [Lachnospiraceae bacterium]